MSSNSPRHTTTVSSAEFQKIKQAAAAARKLDQDKNFSSFWMDQSAERWRGQLEGVKWGKRDKNLSELIELVSYHRAITNFVKITTGKEIPVRWAGSQSHTCGQSIQLSAEIDQSNFDVTVGLALHEASHVLLTDFQLTNDLYSWLRPYSLPPMRRSGVLQDLRNQASPIIDRIHKCFGLSGNNAAVDVFHQIANWLEDRRIDHFVFSSSPGYKAYYHKLYNHYWNTEQTAQALSSALYRDPRNWESWKLHIYNLISPYSKINALPNLAKIAKVIDVRNVGRWTSTKDVFYTTIEVLNLVLDTVESLPALPAQAPPPPAQKPQQADPADLDYADLYDDQQDDVDDDQEEQEEEDDAGQQQDKEGGSNQLSDQNVVNDRPTSNQQQPSSGDDEDDDGSDSQQADDDPLDHSAEAEQAADRLLNQQDKFLDQERMDNFKVKASRNLQRELEETAAQDMEVVVTSFKGVGNVPAGVVIQDYTTRKVSTLLHALETGQAKWKEDIGPYGVNPVDWFNYPHNTKAVTDGIQFGQLLGRKLVRHNEQRSTVTNRLRSGKIDLNRLAHAGYGIESVFKQTQIDQCKPATIHISLDASGSMNGDRWRAAIKMVVAIAKAATMVQNVAIKVDARNASSDSARAIILYDSKINPLQHLTKLLTYFQPSGSTPESLCFEAMMIKNLIASGSHSHDSYFINLSDGQPGGPNDYQGYKAIVHCQQQCSKIESQLKATILSFLINEEASTQGLSGIDGKVFQRMYRSAARAIDTNSLPSVASELNQILLQAKL